MPVLNVLEGLDATGGMPALPFRPTETNEIFSKAFDWGVIGRNPIQSSIAEGRDRNERAAAISERFGAEYLNSVKRDAADSLRSRAPVPGVEAGGMQYGAQIAQEADSILNARIAEGRRTGDPAWQGLRTDAEIEEDQRNIARDIKTEYETALGKARTPSGALIGSIGGSVSGSLFDPVNLATMPLGVGAGAGILRSIAVETLMNAGIEAAQTPFVAAWQHELGYKYGFGEAAADVAMAGAGAGVLTGVAKGLGAGFRALSRLGREGGARSMPILDDIAGSPRVSSEVRDAAKYMSRTAHIDENAAPTADIAEGRAAAQETQNAFKEYRQPSYPEKAWTHDDVLAMREEASQAETDMLRSVEERTAGKTPIDAEFKAASDQKKAFATELKSLKKPQSVIAFLKANGGLRENAGDLRSIGVEPKRMPGLLNNKSGRTLDEGGELLQQAGYFAERPDTNQVLELISNEISNGTRVVRQSELNAELRRNELSAHLAEIDKKLADAPFWKEAEARNRGVDLATAAYRKKTEERIALLREEADKAAAKLPRTEIAPTVTENVPVSEAEATSPEGFPSFFNDPEADLVIRPNDASASMLADLEAGAHLETDDAFDADFQRLLLDNADETVLVDGAYVRLGDLNDDIKADMNIIQAVKTCAIG